MQNVLCCIGSGGVNDFTNIKALLATPQGKLTLVRNFSALSSALPINGYDLDDEDLYDAPTIATLSEIPGSPAALCGTRRRSSARATRRATTPRRSSPDSVAERTLGVKPDHRHG
ncbi:MAG: hypothetical protein E6J90_29540 [Deltaproteobacteria bacterium]|nr:MAG: hypothetical protein E6J90_29540 [Deltaproteobacteria bacterium]TMQ20158.1 MAG: hypothetical protein E6J91_04450 [Deltaproteobacteria bacterium]